MGGIRVVLGPRYSNLNSVVVQSAQANNDQHSLQLDAGLIGVGYSKLIMLKGPPSLEEFLPTEPLIRAGSIPNAAVAMLLVANERPGGDLLKRTVCGGIYFPRRMFLHCAPNADYLHVNAKGSLPENAASSARRGLSAFVSGSSER